MTATQIITKSLQLDQATTGAKGKQAFNALSQGKPLSIASLLESAVTFVEQQHKRNSAQEIPYEPINVKPNPKRALANGITSPERTGTVVAQKKSVPESPAAPRSPFPAISPGVSWPASHKIGAGLDNLGNTCFLNSALQVLLHTPPLVRYFEEKRHNPQKCQFRKKKGFCMSCEMPNLINASFRRSSSYAPRTVIQNLRVIAKHMRYGRQEDSHEFLRFCIDNMQLSEMFGKDPKMPQKFKDSTFVHQIFGGRLRSRVKCLVCDHPSDTYDSVLDLSLDLGRGVTSLRDALVVFTKVDKLSGSNKYKCEKCKKLVNAEKSFTIEDAPMVLTVHLKRFTPSGRKIGGSIAYPENLKLGPYMSHAGMDPSYKLYGIINHSGGGPHSGHYTAHVKASNGQWHSMNDSSVTPCSRAPLNSSNAYVLFYCREQGSALRDAIYAPVQRPSLAGPSTSASPGSSLVNGHVNGKKARASDPGPGLDRSGAIHRDTAQSGGLGEVMSRKRSASVTGDRAEKKAEEAEEGHEEEDVDDEEEWGGIPTSDLGSPAKKKKKLTTTAGTGNGDLSSTVNGANKSLAALTNGDRRSSLLGHLSPKQLRKLERKRQRSQSLPSTSARPHSQLQQQQQAQAGAVTAMNDENDDPIESTGPSPPPRSPLDGTSPGSPAGQPNGHRSNTKVTPNGISTNSLSAPPAHHLGDTANGNSSSEKSSKKKQRLQLGIVGRLQKKKPRSMQNRGPRILKE